jgi:DNA-binding CsgD family transcriptional regulator
MSVVAVSDRHRKVVALRVEGRTCREIADVMGYASPQVVSNILNDPDVKSYHQRIRARLEDSLTDATRYLLSDVIEFAAIPKRGAVA